MLINLSFLREEKGFSSGKEEHVGNGGFAPWLKKKSSEYFRTQCFISLDANDGPLMKSLVELGVEDCIVWGSDYPHFDCTFPGVLQEVRESVASLPKRAQPKIIGKNAARLYQIT